MQPAYNFKLKPEAIWLVVNTVLGTILIAALAYVTDLQDIPEWTDLRAWLIALGLSAIRTLLGAVIALATGTFMSSDTPPPPAG